ncbi:MAG: hypothetical protein ACXWNL_16235 [Vulcanimicrobiaceae bacterium]
MTTKIHSVRVEPVPGRTILMPERAYQAVPATGARVYLDAFYVRAINQGDLKVVPDAPAAAAPAAAPAPAPADAPAPAEPLAPAPIPVPHTT